MNIFEEEHLATSPEGEQVDRYAFLMDDWNSHYQLSRRGPREPRKKTVGTPRGEQPQEFEHVIIDIKLKRPPLGAARDRESVFLEPGIKLNYDEEPARVGAYGIQTSSRASQSAFTVFSALELFLPKRIATEEIGDALEVICQLSRRSRPVWQIYLKVITTVFWVLLNAVRELSSALLGRKRA